VRLPASRFRRDRREKVFSQTTKRARPRLKLDDSFHFRGVVAGFNGGEKIDLAAWLATQC
jgi:Fe-S cluster assembly ATPase SufC